MDSKPNYAVIAGVLVVLALVLAWGHGRLPDIPPHPPSPAPDLSGSELAEALAPLLPEHPGHSGIVPVTTGMDAFAVRATLAEAASHTLDVQYYIWRNDLSGMLLLDALRRAADRGVHVRLLLDDVGTAGMDELLAAMDAHPRIEVRLFNPFVRRQVRWLELLTDFPRLNRRMHNKSFTADRAATIVGGRNVGDEYFGASSDLDFIDIDVLAAGPVVEEVAQDFDRYWDSRSSYPISLLVEPPGADAVVEIDAQFERRVHDPRAQTYLQAVKQSAPVRRLLKRELDFEWTTVKVLSDDPAKVRAEAGAGDMLPVQLLDHLGTPRQELHIISSYFVPTPAGVALLGSLAREGVDVGVLTNSLAATDVAAVHAGYARYREALLREGVNLYELKSSLDGPRAGGISVVGSGRGGSGASSSASLHAKIFVVDGRRLFVGSFNFDPRSARLNTEMGLVIDSPALASRVSQRFASGWRQEAWRVTLDEAGEVRWYDAEENREFSSEPGAPAWLRGVVGLMTLLPIDPLL